MGDAALITGLAGATEDERVETPTARATRRLLRRKGAAFGLFVIALLVALALLAPLISPYDPNLQTWSAVRKAPSASHWFGTDDVGRDVLARVIYGARASLLAGVISVAIALFVGVPIGVISGYVGGFVDALFGRITDAVLACPFLILAIALAAFLGPSLGNAMIAIGITPPPSSPKRRCLFWALVNNLPRLRGAACSIPPSVSSSMRPGWRFGRGLQFFLLFLPSTWSAMACATHSIRARVDRAASQGGGFTEL